MRLNHIKHEWIKNERSEALTLDKLIAQLIELRKTVAGDTPVWCYADQEYLSEVYYEPLEYEDGRLNDWYGDSVVLES